MKGKIFLMMLGVLLLLGGAFAQENSSCKVIDNSISGKDFSKWRESMISLLTKENFKKIIEDREYNKVIDDVGLKLQVAWESGDDKKVNELEDEWSALISDSMKRNADSYIGLDFCRDYEMANEWLNMEVSESSDFFIEEIDSEYIINEATGMDEIMIDGDSIFIGSDVISVEQETRSFWDTFKFW